MPLYFSINSHQRKILQIIDVFSPSNNKLSAELKTKLDERYSAYLIDAIISGVSDDITLGNLIAREAALKEEGYEPHETRFALISLLAQKRRELAQFRGGCRPVERTQGTICFE